MENIRQSLKPFELVNIHRKTYKSKETTLEIMDKRFKCTFHSFRGGLQCRPILRRGVNPPPQSPEGRPAHSACWPQKPSQKGLGFQGLSGLVYEASPGLPWPPWPGLWRTVLACFGWLWPHLASPGMPWRALASFGLA